AEVSLGPHPGNVDQIRLRNAFASPQDRSGNVGVVMVGEATCEFPRHQMQVGEGAAECGQGPQLDALGQADQDIVEHLDVARTEAMCVLEKQPSHLLQHPRAQVRGAGFQDVVELGNQIGGNNCHGGPKMFRDKG
ncbi:hypothetical protein CEE87_13220, partial [Lactobacillus crispatus]